MNMKKRTLCYILGLSLVASNIVGCAHSNSKSKAAPQGEIIGNIPADSKFSKITINMPMKQVYDLIGQPTDTKSYMTGKAFIPFYMGNDAARFDALYKGEGRITFAGGSGVFGNGAYKVFNIIYDPKEAGYNQ